MCHHRRRRAWCTCDRLHYYSEGDDTAARARARALPRRLQLRTAARLVLSVYSRGGGCASPPCRRLTVCVIAGCVGHTSVHSDRGPHAWGSGEFSLLCFTALCAMQTHMCDAVPVCLSQRCLESDGVPLNASRLPSLCVSSAYRTSLRWRALSELPRRVDRAPKL